MFGMFFSGLQQCLCGDDEGLALVGFRWVLFGWMVLTSGGGHDLVFVGRERVEARIWVYYDRSRTARCRRRNLFANKTACPELKLFYCSS